MILRPALRAAVPLAMATLIAAPAGAETRLDLGAVHACVTTAADEGNSPQACVDQAHAPCLSLPGDTRNVTSLCFNALRDGWSTAIAGRMASLRQDAPQRVATLAAIELKYDLLAALVQCDRLEEIEQLRETASEEILLQKSRCTATASGLAYVRLLWRMPDHVPTPSKEKDQ
ncbi:hypothetical protein [Antarctobacter jejuensis]|uniref:hypothetical protein n=1 Tax=Antarctobacter jejuensis TaxID=1439938 RepID=UPI003FD2DCC5